jgi:TonB family protein
MKTNLFPSLSLLTALSLLVFGCASAAKLPPGDNPARVMRIAQPVYPPEMVGTDGEVVVEFEIDERGLAQNVRVVKSTDVRFDRAAVLAVQRSAFRPATRNGIAVRSMIQMPVGFQMTHNTNRLSVEGPRYPGGN